MWIVYLIQHTKTKQICIGFTHNLKQRIIDHNSNNQKATHRLSGKWILIYAEAYRSKKDAIERENKLKSHGSAKHGLKRRIINSFL